MQSLLQACEAAEEELTGVFLTHLENWACRRRAVEAIALDSQAPAPSSPVLASRSWASWALSHPQTLSS